MKAVAALVLLLINVRLSHCCGEVQQIWFCRNIPSAFRPDMPTLVLGLEGVGEINSTVLRSDNLTSVTSLIIDSSGVTGIAEGAFGSFMKLTNLSLSQNSLTEMNSTWFGRPDVLRELNLSENHIEVLHESNLKGFSNLTRLDLSNNHIGTIDPNSFSSNTILAELDLSGNRMTRVPPQIFRSLRSTKTRLDGNPWDCSCGAADFVDFLKDLRSRSLLDRQAEVTCASPPSLRGRPVWDVSVCVTSPTTSVTQTAHRKPTSAKVVTKPPSETKTSVQPPDAPVTMSSNTAATPPARPTSETKPSVTPKPSDVLTTVTTSTLTSAARVTEISVRPEPSDLPRATSTPTGMTETCATSRPSSDTNIVFALVVVIVVLSSLLFVGFFLRRRNRNGKAVTPGRPEENGPELKEDGRSSRAPSPGHSEKRDNHQWDSETGWRTAFTGVRAKSANAVLFMSPFCAPVKDEVTWQTETEARSEDAENRAGGKQNRGDDTEVDAGVETDDADVIKDGKQAEAGGEREENSHRVSVNTNTVPYLSIGTHQNKPSPDEFNKQSTDGSARRSQTGKVMGRISTWPPTAVQWQARCRAKEEEEEEEEEGSGVFTVWTPRFPAEVKTVLKTEERPSGSDWDKKEDDIENNLVEGLRTAPNQDPLKMAAAPVSLGPSRSSKPNDTTCLSEALTDTGTRLEEQLKKEQMILDPTTVGRAQTLNEGKLSPDQDLKSAANRAQKKSSHKAEQRSESKRGAASRQRAESGPKAPSGGATPDDETLLSGNEYAFMDLLHEVVQNNGRWTRDRWKQKEANKQQQQRRRDRAAEGV